MHARRKLLALTAAAAALLPAAVHAENGEAVHFLGRVAVQQTETTPESVLTGLVDSGTRVVAELAGVVVKPPPKPCRAKNPTAHIGGALTGYPRQSPPFTGDLFIDWWTEDDDPGTTDDGITANVGRDCAKVGGFSASMRDVSTWCEPRDHTGSVAFEWAKEFGKVNAVMGLTDVPYFTKRGKNTLSPALPCWRYNATVLIHADFYYYNNLDQRIQYDCIERSWPVEFYPEPGVSDPLNADVTWVHVGDASPESRCAFFEASDWA